MYAALPIRAKVDAPLEQSFEAPNTVEAIHYGCLHPADLAACMEVEEGTAQDDGGSAEKVLIAVHPRWCTSCIEHRTAFMKERLIQRIQTIHQTVNGELACRVHTAYVEGVVEGRIYAQTAPLNETDHSVQERFENTDCGVDELVEMLHGAQMHPDDEKDLARLMMRCRMKVDESGWSKAHSAELEYELDIVLLEESCRSKGFEHGRRLQARLEKHALQEPDQDKREAMLEHNLL